VREVTVSDQSPTPKPANSRASAVATLLIVVAAFGLFAAIGALRDSPGPGQPPATTTRPTTTAAPASVTPETTTETTPSADASARAACQHFRNIMQDVADGTLTDTELRDKFREVRRLASVSEEPGLAEAGTKLLASMTAGTTEELLLAAGDFDQECDEAGL
jgi:hypothetical protein